METFTESGIFDNIQGSSEMIQMLNKEYEIRNLKAVQARIRNRGRLH